MIGDADFAYAQARIQARHGTRLTEHEWRRLNATHDVAQYLHVLRSTRRARWVERITSDMGVHALEARLRAEWRAYVREIARFQPEPWQPPVGWIAYLVDLPVLDHLLRGGAVHPWMAEDEIYAPWRRTDLHERERALELSAVAALVLEAHKGNPVAQAGLAIWRRLWPRVSPEHTAGLETIVRTVERHAATLRDVTGQSSFELRMELKQRLEAVFRRHGETAAAAVAHLLLEALDLERLRAGLVRRLLVVTARMDAA